MLSLLVCLQQHFMFFRCRRVVNLCPQVFLSIVKCKTRPNAEILNLRKTMELDFSWSTWLLREQRHTPSLPWSRGVEFMGAHLSAYTFREHTAYYMKTLPRWICCETEVNMKFSHLERYSLQKKVPELSILLKGKWNVPCHRTTQIKSI